MKNMKKTFVLSVGGSLIVTKEGINHDFLKKFKIFINQQIKKGYKFYLVVGGGVTARTYIKVALRTNKIKNFDRDQIGIRATRLNAELLRAIFSSVAYPELIIDPKKKIKTNKKLILAGGYKPGWSTDYVAVLMAYYNNIDTVINLSNIDYAYNKDPKLFKDAKKMIISSWPEFRKIVGSKWSPGLNLPFDPIASRAAHEYGQRVVILNGQKLDNLGACLTGRKFKGTVIS